ncbi:hypothetical protein [Shinella sp.]|uniref:hypothetical protein n=1 Tax=Shinella sp. TaxID=1870904 RepID=UPI0040353EB6
MKILRLAAWTVWFMLCAITFAHADPISAAIGAIAGLLKAGGIAATLLKLAFTVALQVGTSLLQRAAAKKQAQPGISGQLQVGGNNSFSFFVGSFATAGSLDYVGTWGAEKKTPNAYFTSVVTLSDLPQPGISSRVFINNEMCEIDFEADPVAQGYPVKEYRRGDRDYLWVKVLTGEQTTADAFLTTSFGGDPDRPWEPDMIGVGSTVVILTARFNREIFTSWPVGRYEPLAVPLYDPRKDSTVGGSGLHRWGQPATYEATANPIVIVYNILRGIHFDGERLYGPGISAPRLPLASWIAGMNECDLPIAIKGGGTEPQFQAGYEIKIAEHEPADVIDELLKACNGQIAEIGGVYKVRVGPPGLPVMFVTDEDFIITDPQELDPFKGLEATFNGATASYPDPAAAWEMKDAPQRLFPALEVEDDNRQLLANFQFSTVSRPRQVQRLMKSMILDGRSMRSHRGTLSPIAFGLEPLDVISWSSARNGYIDKLFDIRSKDEMANVNQSLAMIEVDPGDYDWTPNTDELPWIVGDLDPRWPPVQDVTGFAVFPDSINDNAGTPRRPVIRVVYDGDLDDVRAVGFQIKLNAAADADLIAAGDIPYGDPATNPDPKSTRINNTLPPAMALEARFAYLPFSGREFTWSGWLPVTTLDVRLIDADVYLPGMVDEINEKLDELREFMGGELDAAVAELLGDIGEVITQIEAQATELTEVANGLSQEVTERTTDAIAAAAQARSILGAIDTLRQFVVEQDFANYSDMAEIRRALTVRMETTFASFDERITVAVSETAAIVQRVADFQVSAGELNARLTTIDQARVDGDVAITQQMALLTAGTDNQFDPYVLWGFDTTVEGFSGNGTPTVSNGWLRPADHASDPYVVSAAVAAVAATYRQVRLRIRRYGSPTWEGYLWWAAEGQSWDTGRRMSVAEPVFDGNGVGLITFDPDWSGTIERIRLDLSTAQTSSNYFTIDWVSIGSPSPGASRAALAAERLTRIDSDSALASSIEALSAELTDATGELSGLATGVSTLTASVDDLGDEIVAQGAALTALTAEVDEKASVDALTALEAEVSAIGGGGVVSQGSAITAIRNTLLPMAGMGVEQDFANFLDKMDGLRATAEAATTLDNRIELTNEGIAIVSRAVTQVKAELPGFASGSALSALTTRVTLTESSISSVSTSIASISSDLAGKASTSALNALTTRVTEAEGTITSQSSSITSINASLTGKASTAALSALTSRVTATEGDITAMSSSITSINSTLGTKASTSALNALTTRVTEAENTITSQASSITSINSTLGTKASTSALNALTTRVSDAEGSITSQASSITAINATVGNVSAGGRFRVDVEATPSGARSRIGLSAAANGSEASSEAALFLEAITGGKSRVVIVADQFAVLNGSARQFPFVIEGGVVRMNVANIGTVNAGLLESTNGKMTIDLNNGRILIRT